VGVGGLGWSVGMVHESGWEPAVFAPAYCGYLAIALVWKSKLVDAPSIDNDVECAKDQFR
jgi:hypothetical protein